MNVSNARIYTWELIQIEFKLMIISVLLLMALVSDLITYKIKNAITYSFMLIGLTANLASEGIYGLVFSLLGIMLPVACLVVLYMIRVIGAGDIKLLSAVGAVMGAGFALDATVSSFICGGFIASGIILSRQNGMERLRHLVTYIQSCILSMELLQYSDFKDRQENGKFHFSFAIVSGTAAVVLIHGCGWTF